MIKDKRWMAMVVLIPILILFIKLGVAEIQSLATYLIKKDVVDMGGAASQSTNYHLVDAIGQPGGLGEATSTNYRESSGFFADEGGAPTTPMLSVSPTTLDFGISTNSLPLQIANVGSGTLTWTIAESPDKPWLISITPSNGSGNATVTVTVDRSFLISNSDTGTLAVTSNGGNANVAVLISKPPVGSVVISAPNLTGASGTIDVPIAVTDLTGKNVVGLTVTVETQPTVLTPTGATTSGTVLGAWGSVFTNVVGGQITFSGADVNPLNGSGTLIILHYQANCLAAGATSPIHFVSAVLNEGDPPCTTQDGSFTCAAGFNVAGKVLYYQNSNPVDNATMTLDGYTETTGNDGSFAFTAVPGGNLTLTPTKDADLGNSISAFDASMILRHSVGLITLTPYQLLAADVSGNGSVSAFDASFILRYTVGLINSFPVGDDWRFVPSSFAIDLTNWSIAPKSISYAPLNSNQADQDFKGIVYGDVSGNWSLFGLAKNVNGSAAVEFGEVVHVSQHEFVVPVKANVTGDMFSTELIIKFDPEVVNLEEIKLGERLSEYSEFHKLEAGTLAIAFAATRPINSNIDLVSLKFAAKDPESKQTTDLTIADAAMNEGQIAVNVSQSSLSLNPALPSMHQLEQNYPNPFNPTTTISYSLARPAKVVLTIFDVNGKEIKRLVQELKPAGYHQVEWNAIDHLGNAVTSGVYFCRIEALGTEGKIRPFTDVKKLILMK